MTTSTLIRFLVMLSIALGLSCGGEEQDREPSRAAQGLAQAQAGLERAHLHRLEMAVVMLEGSLHSFQDGGGYRTWTASEAADMLVKTLNTSSQRLPGEPEAPGPEITYRLGSPSAPWQIVLIPDNSTRTIVVNGYAKDLTTPHSTEKLLVPQY